MVKRLDGPRQLAAGLLEKEKRFLLEDKEEYLDNSQRRHTQDDSSKYEANFSYRTAVNSGLPST